MSSGISSNGTSRQLLGFAMEAIPAAVVVIDSSGQILLVNREAERLFHYEPSVLQGQPVEVLLPERFRSRHPQLRNDYFHAPQARRMGSGRELFGLRKDGSEFPVEIGLNPMETTEGTFVLAAIVDITERFQAAETLARVQRLAALNLAEDATQARRRAEQAEERLNLALQSAGIGTWSWDVIRDVITWDDFIPAIFGHNKGELSPKYDDFIVMVHPEDRERVTAAVWKTVEEGVPYDTDYRVFWPNGELHVVAVRGKVYRDERGQPVRMTGVCWDITERRLTELTLKESQERFALAVEGSQDGIWDWNVLTNEVFYSPRWKSMLGYSNEEISNQFSEWERLVHPDDLPRAKQALEHYFAGESPDYTVEFRMRPKSGDWKWILARGVAQRDAQGAVVRMSGSHTDITGRKKTEQNLAAANAQLAGVLDASTQISIIATDLNGLITVFNTGAENLLGYSADEMIGRQNPGVFHRADEMLSCGVELTRELGYPVEGFEVFVAYAKRGQHFRREWTYVRKDGSEFLVNLVITSVLNAVGEITGYLGIAEDITERHEAQAVMAQQAEELARSNKELEQFAYIASHDLQEPLRKVQTFGDMLSTQAGPALDATAQDYLKRMQNAAGRMQNFINDLLTYSRVSSQAKPFERVELGQIALEVIGDLEHRIQTTAGQVRIGDLPALDADSLQMRQLLQNLIGNALKFHRPGVPPVVTVQSRLMTLSKGKKANAHDATPQCEITVQDNGIGFEEKYLDRIFAPFQRLHGRGEFEGTGIGLAICHKIVERHGGTITAKSTPGEGTTFIVTLPQQQTAEAPPHA